MVLFEKDFYEQNAFVQTGTKNLSFLKMAILLNKMGIKNNKFMLSIYDKDLMNYDPHNLNDDSLELRQRIAVEAKINYWYYIREVVRISASGSGGIPYILNRSNMAQAWVFYNSINGFQVMPRQIGKTIGSMSIASHYLYLAGYNVKWGEFTKGNQLQTENVDRLKKIRDALPKYLLHQTANDTNNKEGIAYDALKTEFLTFVAQNDKQAAGDQARGQSLAVIHIDEAAYYTNIDKSYDSATAVMDAAAEQARASGLPAAILITTTAGDIDDPRGKWCYRTVCDALRFTEKLYDCKDYAELDQVVRNNSRNNYLYMEYSYKQLGKDDRWFENVTRNKDPRVIQKDYLNVWLRGSGSTIFPREMLKRITESRKDPVTVTTKESLLIRWYDDPRKLMDDTSLKERPYVIGCDTSDDCGKDFTTMCMVDPYDLHIVCTFKCNTTNLVFVARCLVDFLRDFPRAIFIPERNKVGSFMIDYVFAEMTKEAFNPLNRMYNLYYQEYTPETDIGRLDYADGKVRQKFGFSTTKNSRDMLYNSVLMTALDLVGDRLNDSSIIDEIAGLQKKNNRIDHSEKGHDDLLISWLLCCYFIIFGANHHLYGIRPDELMCNVSNGGSLIDAEEKKKQIIIQNQIIDLKGKLKHQLNPIIRAAWERELRNLVAMVGDVNVDKISKIRPLDQVKKEAAVESRRQNPIDLVSYFQYA